MPDIYASIRFADSATLDRLTTRLELRAADLLKRGILHDFVSEIALPENAKMLEIGCGTGAFTRFLAGLPQVAQALGVDPSPVFVAKARELAGQFKNLSFQEGEARALPSADRSFDAVVFHTTLCHIPKPEEALAEALRVLRPGGWLAIFDGDNATMSVANGNFDPLQCCADAVVDGVYDRWLVRRLPAILRSLGLEAPRFRTYGYTALSEPSYMFTIVDRGADLLVSGGQVGSELAVALKAEARRRVQFDGFYGVIVFASAVARKPT